LNAQTERRALVGPAGTLDCAIDHPAEAPRGLALVCHPHPQHGGTMDNKVVQTLARACVQRGYTSARFNFRGIGASAGAWDEGRGEIDDALAVLAALRAPGQPLVLAGFSFGAYVASQVAARLAGGDAPQRVVLIAPAVVSFTVAAPPAGSLVVHGEADDVVPLSAVLDWARPITQPVVVVPAVGHFFHGQLPLLRTLVTQFLS
jgi:alpha/beta superfamily hydrolase